MSSNKTRFMRPLFKANGSCGCSKSKSSDIHQPTPKPKISLYQNTNSRSLNSSTSSGDGDGDGHDKVFTFTTISEPYINQNPNNKKEKDKMEKPSSKLVNTVTIEKDSNDPYKDFSDSILQMIVKREIYTETDLQELLERFLQLNATCHHQIIIQAFMEICEQVFPKKKISGGDGAASEQRRII